MMTGRLLSCCKRACEHTSGRWALPALAVAASVCGADIAQAQRFSVGGFRPSMPSISSVRPSVGGMGSMSGVRVGIGSGVVAGAITSVGRHRPHEEDYVPLKRRWIAKGTSTDDGDGPPKRKRVTDTGPGRTGGSGAPVISGPHVPNEIVTEMRGNPTDEIFALIGTRHRLNRIETQRIGLTNSTFVRWRIADRRSVPVVMRAMRADNTVRSAVVLTQPNYLFATQQDKPAEAEKGGPGDAPPAEQVGDAAQYALAKLHLPEAQALARGNSVVVAVIDTEIDATHPELAGAVTDSFDALGIAGPRETHGTGIAGTIAGHARLLGAAPNVRILAIRAFGSGIGTTFTIIKGLDYAVAHDARVINMSFAGPSDPALTRALAAAHGRGRILVAAVGNKGPKSPALFPAADPNVIAVTATDAKDRLFEGANRGDHVAIAAPGVDILVAAPGSTYSMSTGTSFASAYVAGVAALLAERKPDITPDGAKAALMSTAHDLGPKGRDPQFGAGLMDAKEAILSVNGRPAAEIARGTGH
jgi:subtilisin family serine protease